MKYRPEIDGLRSVAVIPVLLFHAGIAGFSGGFVGVDVFFVISGYLITAIIMKELKQGNFSIAKFYERRARRILPALYFVIFASMPLAWLLMMPSQLKDFSQSIVAVSVFSANIYFYLKSGYFEPAGEVSPMHHTWSLAVEEQFYFVFPLILILLHWCAKKLIVPSIIALAFVSYFYAEYLLDLDPSQCFFLPLSRAWELMIGAFINFLPKRPTSRVQAWDAGAWLGLLLIIGSILFLDENTPFPGFFAVPSVIGAALIIYCASETSGPGRLLATPPFVGIGLLSYSIYLWHQPLFAFTRLSMLGEPPAIAFLGLGLLSIGLAYFSWRYIERPFRNREKMSRKTLVWICSLAIAPTLALGMVGHWTKGFAEIKYQMAGEQFRSFDAKLRELKAERVKLWKTTLKKGSAAFTDQEVKKVLVLGDSRGEDLFVSLWENRGLFPNTEFRYQRLDDLCFAAVDNPSSSMSSACAKEAQALVKRMETDAPDVLLISCGWQSGSSENLATLLDYLERRTECIVFGSASFNDIASQFYALSLKEVPRSQWPQFFSRNVHTASKNASLKLMAEAEKRSVRFVNVYDFFETEGSDSVGEPVFDLTNEDGTPLIIDQTHLTVEAARKFGRHIKQNGWSEVN